MKSQRRFRTRLEVERYFSGKTIECLLCGRRFVRLASHLVRKHKLSSDQYKARFGLPWRRGLSSAESHANSGWDEKRRKKASKAALQSQFFKFAHPSPRREWAPFIKAEIAERLARKSAGYGKKFNIRVRELFRSGYSDQRIAEALGVARMTVNVRTRRWRKRQANK